MQFHVINDCERDIIKVIKCFSHLKIPRSASLGSAINIKNESIIKRE